MSGVEEVMSILFGKKPKWKVARGAREVLKGLYVKEILCYMGPEKLVPATPSKVLRGKILRDAVGGAILFNKNGEIVGHIEVVYSVEFPEQPIALMYKDNLIAYRV